MIVEPNLERLYGAVETLISAYERGELFQGYCRSCAVGNLVSKGCGYGSDLLSWRTLWTLEFGSYMGDQSYERKAYYGLTNKQIDSTGYSVDELELIERKFEGCDDAFGGLCGVIEVLYEIEGLKVESSVYERLNNVELN